MKFEWLGRYRQLTEKIVRYGNAYARTYNKPIFYGTNIDLTTAEVQTLEYILENEELKLNMVDIASRLGVSSSVFSKYVKQMLDRGLLEKYHILGNRKNIIIRASPLGRELYTQYCKYEREIYFENILSYLDDIPDEYISRFSTVLDLISDSLLNGNKKEAPLIKIE